MCYVLNIVSKVWDCVSKVERARVTLLRCYAEVANQAPASALLPRLEDGLMDWLITQLSQAKVSPAAVVSIVL